MMTCVYDILLNFETNYYEPYEWDKSDKIIHIRKIPLFKVYNNDFNNFKYSLVHFDKKFLYKIQNQTQKYNKRKISVFNYCFLVSNGKEVVGLKLNKNGNSIYKSSLLFDEREEIIDIASNLAINNINYNVISKRNETFETRYEQKIKKIALNNINKLYRNTEKDKLKYIYLDCFNKRENDILVIYKQLIKEIQKNDVACKKIYDFFEIIK